MPLPATPPDEAQLLERVPLFRGLAPADLAAVAGAARRRRIPAGGFLFRQDDPAETYYVLVTGRARVAQLTPEGQEVILHLAGPGDTLGIAAALAADTGEVFPASVEATDDCVAFAWDGQVMAGLMERYPRLALNALRIVVTRMHELGDRYRELATERVERRVARALLRLVRQNGRRVENGVLIDFPLSRQDLAELTGTTLYSVSRILSAWEGRGLIDSGRERVLIRQPHALVTIAEDLYP